MVFEIMPPAVFGLTQSGLLAVLDMFFPIDTLLIVLLSARYLLHDVASFFLDDTITRISYFGKMGLK